MTTRRDFLDSMVFTPEGLRHLAAEGTDFPYPWTKTAVDHVLATPGLGEQKLAILGGTALKPSKIGS